MFPRVPDHHKRNRPLVPNGVGVLYVLASVTYLFLVYWFRSVGMESSNNYSRALTLAVCILFGGFMGLLDDWMDLRWRYKAFFPLIAAIPLISLATQLVDLRTTIATPFGSIDFGVYYYFVIIPMIVTITTNTVNQLGGLNGLETICPAIIVIGIMSVSGPNMILLFAPLIVWLSLAFFNSRGKIFVGNTGSFSIGITLAAFAVISDLKSVLLISLLPYIFNSSLILLNYFFFRTKARVSFDGERLSSSHVRSMITLITYRRPSTERKVVAVISLLVAASTSVAVVFQLLSS